MLYSWQSPESLLKEIELFKIGEQQEAFIYAPRGADPSKLQGITESLRQRGFEALPDFVDGKHALRIEKFTSREHLFGALAAMGAISGETKTQITGRDAKPKSLAQRAGESTMNLSGWLFTVGDALMILSGWKRRDYAEAGTGFIWGSTGLVLGLFGKKKPEKQLSTFYRNLEEHLKQEGIPIPRNEQELVDSLKRDNGMITRVIEFLENNPADFHHIVQAIGGTTLIKAGYNQNNWWKGGAGVFVSTGQAMGALLPDKSHKSVPDPLYELAPANGTLPTPANANLPSPANSNTADASDEDKKKTPVGSLPPEPDNRGVILKSWEWFTSNPLHFSGIFPFINNVLNVTGAALVEKPRVDMDLAKTDPTAKKKDFTVTIDGKKTPFHFNGNEIKNIEDDLRTLHEHKATNTNHPDLTSGFAQKTFASGAKDIDSKINQLHDEKLRLEKFRDKDFVEIRGKKFRPYEMNVATSGLYVAANLLYAVSKKNTSADLKATGVIDEMCSVMANIIAAAPTANQEELTHQMAGYLGMQPDVTMTVQEVDKVISEKVAALRESPWEVKPKAQEKPNTVTHPVHMGPVVAANANAIAQPGVA